MVTVAQQQQMIPLTRDNWATLNRINALVNDTIEQVSDLDHYGVLEWWAFPEDGKGDCEGLTRRGSRGGRPGGAEVPPG